MRKLLEEKGTDRGQAGGVNLLSFPGSVRMAVSVLAIVFTEEKRKHDIGNSFIPRKRRTERKKNKSLGTYEYPFASPTTERVAGMALEDRDPLTKE